MKEFDIRDHIWDIYRIASENNKDIILGFKMFIKNIELGYARYSGAPDVDFSKLSNIWNNLPESYRKHEKNIFNKLLKTSIDSLCDAWAKRDKYEINRISHSFHLSYGIKIIDLDT